MDFIKELVEKLEVKIEFELKDGQTEFSAAGSSVAICTALGTMIRILLKKGMDEDLLNEAIKLGFNNGKSNEN